MAAGWALDCRSEYFIADSRFREFSVVAHAEL